MDDLFGDLPPPSSSRPLAPPSTTSGSSKPSSFKPASVANGGSASKRPLGMAGLLSASVLKKHATGAASAPSSLFDDLPPPSSTPSAPTGPTSPGLSATGAASKDKDRAPGESEAKQAAASAEAKSDARGVTVDEAEPGKSNKEEGQQWRVGVEAAVYGSKGRRSSMEDAHIMLDDEACHKLEPRLPKGVRVCMYGVLDGHGGPRVAALAQELLPRHVLQAFAAASSSGSSGGGTMTAAIQQGFSKTAQEVTSRARSEGWGDGCCVVLLVLCNDTAHIANLGDCKAVLIARRSSSSSSQASAQGGLLSNADTGGDGGGSHLLHRFPWQEQEAGAAAAPPPAVALCLTAAHTPMLLAERKRVESSGGSVVDMRLNGQLAVSRSLGDVRHHGRGLSSEPDVSVVFGLDQRQEAFLLACDGLWTRCSEASAAAFVRNRLYAGQSWCHGAEHTWSLGRAVRGLVEDAVTAKGVQDNCSALLVWLAHPQQHPPGPKLRLQQQQPQQADHHD